jgi:hypothetical protein
MAERTKPAGPFKLVTVNTVPERAKRLVGRVVEELSDRYTIIHAANVDSKHQLYNINIIWKIDLHVLAEIEDVATTVREVQPDMLVSSARIP